MKTMHETYGEPNDELGKHICCDKCGSCKTCGCLCNNQKQNVPEGASHSSTLGTIRQTASSDNPQDDSGGARTATKEDTGDSTFPADLNLLRNLD